MVWVGYACVFATATPLTDPNHMAIGAYIESTNEKHLYGVTTNAATVLDPANTADIASQFSLGDYTRTMVQYSITNPYAIASIFGRAFSTNFEGSNTTITLKFKREPLVLPEFLTTTQANTLMQTLQCLHWLQQRHLDLSRRCDVRDLRISMKYTGWIGWQIVFRTICGTCCINLLKYHKPTVVFTVC